MVRESYSKRLREARKNAKLKQVDVMKQIGVNNKTLSGYEAGANQPDFDTLTKLCTLYGVTTDWVLGNTNNPKSSLTQVEKIAVDKINFGDEEGFLEIPMVIEGRELTQEEKQKVLAMARLLLSQGR